MGNLVMPKHSVLKDEIFSAFEIYYEVDDWLDNEAYRKQLMERIGDSQYQSSYTKKIAIYTYFGFIEWEKPENKQSRKRITPLGKQFYKAIINQDVDQQQLILIESMEKLRFGRNNQGANSSESDIEVPNLCIRAIYDLEYITREEFAYILDKLCFTEKDYTDSINDVKKFRTDETFVITISDEGQKFKDAKPIKFLIESGLLQEDGRRVIIPEEINKKFGYRLRKLSIFGIDKSFSQNLEKNSPVYIDSNIPRNIIMYGPPGTGKTYNTTKVSINIIQRNENIFEDLKLDYREQKTLYREYVEEGNIAFTTFHQSYGYEEFIEGLKPYIDDEENLSYRVENGIFKNFCETARTRPSEQFVFIIDEINRGNISKIFGELITLIEQSKRQGGTDEIEVVLPYSNEKFSVPNNVYILGTMNTADKSIQVLDTALRRRFFFKEILPDETIFKNIKVGNIEIEKMLKKMNERIAILLDKNHMIGHAYFIPLLTDSSILTLSSIFQNSIIPLLEEYFYDDYSEVMKILNIDPENSDEKKLISVMDTAESLFVIQDESENMRYSINYSEFKTEDNYIRIYSEI